MAKKYLTPDFDVTSYDIEDVIAGPLVGEGDADDMVDASWKDGGLDGWN